MMPAFAHLPEKERDGIVSFIRNEKQKSIPIDATTSKSKASYIHTGYNRWYDKNGYPVNSPPWGTLTAINLHTGEHLWQAPLGTYPALVQKGLPPTGTDNYGGPLVTASGLVFIAATPDKQFKAFDKLNGKILWQAELPAAGYATPSTYEARGKQFIVIACGGGKLRSKSGDKYVAFALQP
jgi:quinoprotein glucose dehydrogenase